MRASLSETPKPEKSRYRFIVCSVFVVYRKVKNYDHARTCIHFMRLLNSNGMSLHAKCASKHNHLSNQQTCTCTIVF